MLTKCYPFITFLFNSWHIKIFAHLVAFLQCSKQRWNAQLNRFQILKLGLIDLLKPTGFFMPVSMAALVFVCPLCTLLVIQFKICLTQRRPTDFHNCPPTVGCSACLHWTVGMDLNPLVSVWEKYSFHHPLLTDQ